MWFQRTELKVQVQMEVVVLGLELQLRRKRKRLLEPQGPEVEHEMWAGQEESIVISSDY